MRRKQVVTLLSDFGLVDPYVAEMKAIILSIFSDLIIVDISHEISKYNVRMGAIVLALASSWFPEGTIHVAVVDPGVGTKRRPIIIEANHSFYVGPDNGLLMYSVEKDKNKHVFEIVNKKYFQNNISHTFHGRDIFCSVAGFLAKGIPPFQFGSEIYDPIFLSLPKPTVKKNLIKAEIIYIDSFGNIITNIDKNILKRSTITKGGNVQIRIGDITKQAYFCSTYGMSKTGNMMLLFGGTGFLEIAMNQKKASNIFNAEIGKEKIIDNFK